MDTLRTQSPTPSPPRSYPQPHSHLDKVSLLDIMKLVYTVPGSCILGIDQQPFCEIVLDVDPGSLIDGAVG